MPNSYNFTQGNDIIGTETRCANESCYFLTIDLELITEILIVIMICLLVQTGYIFLRHIGLIKGRY